MQPNGNLRRGAQVKLRRDIYEYRAGTAGVVVDVAAADKVLVRFEPTGHTLFVPRSSVAGVGEDVTPDDDASI